MKLIESIKRLANRNAHPEAALPIQDVTKQSHESNESSNENETLPAPIPQPTQTPGALRRNAHLEELKASYDFISALPDPRKNKLLAYYDNAWDDNGRATVSIGPKDPLYHAGHLQRSTDVDQYATYFSYVSPEVEAYALPDTVDGKKTRTVSTFSPVRPLTLANIDYTPGKPDPVSEIANEPEVFGWHDKRRQALLREWCISNNVDGFKRHSKQEIFIAKPKDTLKLESSVSFAVFDAIQRRRAKATQISVPRRKSRTLNNDQFE